MNYTALLVVVALVVGAALTWIALAAKMVADDEEAKARAENQRRKLAHEQQESKKRSRARAAPGEASFGN